MRVACGLYCFFVGRRVKVGVLPRRGWFSVARISATWQRIWSEKRAGPGRPAHRGPAVEAAAQARRVLRGKDMRRLRLSNGARHVFHRNWGGVTPRRSPSAPRSRLALRGVARFRHRPKWLWMYRPGICASTFKRIGPQVRPAVGSVALASRSACCSMKWRTPGSAENSRRNRSPANHKQIRPVVGALSQETGTRPCPRERRLSR
jgi:hypothetical protein